MTTPTERKTPMPIEFARITTETAALLEHVADDVFDGEIDPDRLAGFLAENGHLMLVALDDGLVVGQVAGVVHRHPDQPTELYLDNLGVAPSHRRQGIAARLLDEALALGREIGCEEAWVATETHNEAARSLYDRYSKAETVALYAFDL